MSIKERIVAAEAAADTPAEKVRARAREKARIVAETWATHPGRNPQGVAAFNSRTGTARIGAVEFGEDAHASWVEVWTGPRQGPPQFRVINPPVLVSDPGGDVAIPEQRPDGRVTTRRYREDPVAAVAEAIASESRAEP